MSTGTTTGTSAAAQALSRLTNIAFAFVSSQALLSACDLGVFDALADGPLTADQLAARVSLKPIACRRLLMTLASLDLVEQVNGTFRNSELGQFCSSRSPISLTKVSKINPFFHMFEYLTDALKEYSPRWQQALGTTPQNAFAALYADPARLREFAELMNALSIPQGQLIADAYDFGSHMCLMDVAGGPGGQSIEIALKHPHLRGIVMDLEPVCIVAREYIQAAGLSGRFTAIAADLIAGPYPAGADVILLGHILHDWNDETCRKILRNCAAALPPNGALLVSESVLRPDGSGSSAAHVKDLIMLVANEPDARERTEIEYASLLNDAGFDMTKVIRFDAPRDLVVARKR
jgi:2-polyprenyl-3-methyl-5-hydroxy-6-metoxy-1,4-benzoquinol methylase